MRRLFLFLSRLALAQTDARSSYTAFADAACAPIDFPIAPAKAIPAALKRAGITIDQVAKFEVNEAFSAVAIANQKILDIPSDKLNVSGGAVALGHALGSSGSRIIVTLVHLLQPGEYGVAGVCNVRLSPSLLALPHSRSAPLTPFSLLAGRRRCLGHRHPAPLSASPRPLSLPLVAAASA